MTGSHCGLQCINFTALIHSASAQPGWMYVNEWMDEWSGQISSSVRACHNIESKMLPISVYCTACTAIAFKIDGALKLFHRVLSKCLTCMHSIAGFAIEPSV